MTRSIPESAQNHGGGTLPRTGSSKIMRGPQPLAMLSYFEPLEQPLRGARRQWGGLDMDDKTASIASPVQNPNFLKHQRHYPAIHYLRSGAQRRLPQFAFEYGDGGAGADRCINRNWEALDAVELVPRYGVMPRLPPVDVTLFG